MTAELLTARLAGQLDALEWIIATAPASGFSVAPQSGKWSAHEHVAHLACYQRRFLERLQIILWQERPALARYRAEEDSEWPQWRAMSMEHVLGRLREGRRELAELVASLSDAQLERVGVHPVFGALTVRRWIDFFLIHEAHHAYVVMTLARETLK